MTTGPEQARHDKRLSLVLAAMMMLSLILISSSVVLVDVSSLKKRVEQFFSIDLEAQPDLSRENKYIENEVEAFNESVLQSREGKMFSALGNAPAEAPSRAVRPESASSSLERKTPDEIPIPDLIRKQTPLSQLEEKAVRKEIVSVASDTQPQSVKRQLPEDAAGKLPTAGENKPSQQDEKFMLLKKPELIADPGKSPLPPEMAAPSNHAMPTPTPVQLPNTISLTKKLLAERPKDGYPSLDNDIAASFEVYRQPGSEDAFFRLTLSLRPDSRVATMPKDVFFLVDVSQSIGSSELSAARDAVISCLQALSENDRWNVAVFSESEYVLHKRFVSTNLFDEEEVRKFIARRPDERQTDVFRATRLILSGIPESTRPCNVFLLSDGKATSGTADVKRIVQDFRRANRENFSIFTYNAGPKGNRYLLQLLSYRSRGVFGQCPELSRVSEDLVAFALRYAQPVLSHTVASYTNIQADQVVPQVLPNLYRDAPITFWGRTKPGKTVTLRVAGLGEDGKPREFYFRAEIPKGKPELAVIAEEWAQGRAHLLMAELADDPKNEPIRQELQTLAETYRLDDVQDVLKSSRWLPWR